MKKLLGTVSKANTTNTAVVKIHRHWRHPIYKKIIKRTKKYLVHDDLNVKVGDKVIIQASKPTSKRKRWKITENLTPKSKGLSHKKKKK